MKTKYKLFSLSDFEEFIKVNNISTRSDFQKRFRGAYVKFLKLTTEERDKLLPSTFSDYTKLNDKNSWKKFINDNKITSRSDLVKRFHKAVFKFRNNLTEEEKDELLPSKPGRWKDDRIYIKNINELREYLKENKILTRKGLRKSSTNAYNFFKSLSEEEKNNLLPYLGVDLSIPLNTLDDWLNYVRGNNITTREELRNFSSHAYTKFNKLSKEEKSIVLPTKIRDFSSLKTKNDFIKFVTDNNIISKIDFEFRFSAAYKKFNRILSKEERDEFKFEVDGSSFGEIFLKRLFSENNIKYVSEKTFSELRDIKSLRFDFYLPEYNTVIEYHGSQHFDFKNRYYTKENIEHDKIKYKYAINNSINIFYFTLEKRAYRRCGYFTEVITDPDILINKIKEIGLTNQSSNTNN